MGSNTEWLRFLAGGAHNEMNLSVHTINKV